MIRLKVMIAALALVSFTQSAGAAQQFGYRTDDSDLTRGGLRLTPPPSSELAPDSVQVTPGNTPLVIAVGRMDHGRMTAVSELPITLTSGSGTLRLLTDARGLVSLPARFQCSTGKMHVVAELMNEHFQVLSTHNSHTYRISTDLPCTGTAQLLFKSDSDAGQPLGIWQIATRARAALNAFIGLTFWRSRITFAWPGDGDYYSGGTVNLTRGDYWDVVGHEMGHAIYDLGGLGRFGGGQHKIDECYSTALALSEGWASFFSAWISINPNDPDAKFEYMVPRRAPIRFETIPADVCKGETNEWRVTGFFWDLVDLHQDGEAMNESFARLWNAMKGSRVGSASEAMIRLEKAGIDINGLRGTWTLNFQSPAPN
jgi:hypothetical protein